jgi:hypothetical protein
LKWKCAEGHIWIARLNSRTNTNNNGSGCPGCEKNGFNPEKNAYVYLLKHNSWKMLQIGITNSPKSRLAKHRQSGWIQLDLVGPSQVLRYLKYRKVIFANKAGGKKFDGWTEAWIASSLKVKSVKEIMKLTEELEKK